MDDFIFRISAGSYQGLHCSHNTPNRYLVQKGLNTDTFKYRLVVKTTGYIEDLTRVVISYEIYETSRRRVS